MHPSHDHIIKFKLFSALGISSVFYSFLMSRHERTKANKVGSLFLNVIQSSLKGDEQEDDLLPRVETARVSFIQSIQRIWTWLFVKPCAWKNSMKTREKLEQIELNKDLTLENLNCGFMADWSNYFASLTSEMVLKGMLRIMFILINFFSLKWFSIMQLHACAFENKLFKLISTDEPNFNFY